MWRQSVDLIDQWPGVSSGWREGLRGQVASLDRIGWVEGGATLDLALELDQSPATSVSLLAFRRRPWPARLGSIALDASRLAVIDMPSAARLPETSSSAFLGPGCSAPRSRDP